MGDVIGGEMPGYASVPEDPATQRRQYVDQYRGVFLVCVPSAPEWSWTEGTLDLSTVVDALWVGGERMTHAWWRQWYIQEFDIKPKYMRRMAEALCTTPEVFGPVVVAFLPDGQVDIGDGWHRIALAVMLGIKSLKAIVGRQV